MAERPDHIDHLAKLAKQFDVRSRDLAPELESRLRREEADAAHQRRKDFLLSACVLALVAVVALACLAVMVFALGSADTQKSAASLLTVIVSAAAGYMTGKAGGK